MEEQENLIFRLKEKIKEDNDFATDVLDILNTVVKTKHSQFILWQNNCKYGNSKTFANILRFFGYSGDNFEIH